VNKKAPAAKSFLDITLRIADCERPTNRSAAAKNMLNVVALISATKLENVTAVSAATGFPKALNITPIMSPIAKSVKNS
jgi:hypothetical protein